MFIAIVKDGSGSPISNLLGREALSFALAVSLVATKTTFSRYPRPATFSNTRSKAMYERDAFWT